MEVRGAVVSGKDEVVAPPNVVFPSGASNTSGATSTKFPGTPDKVSVPFAYPVTLKVDPPRTSVAQAPKYLRTEVYTPSVLW